MGAEPAGEKVIVITGASAGIGAAAAEALAARGHSVVVVARRREALEAVAARCGARALVVVADVSRRPDVKRAVDEAIARFGRIDVWVNNAGVGITRMPSELTDEDVDTMMRANVMSALYGMQEVLPHFRSRGAGHIINVSSMLGRMPLATFRSAYCGAKHFLNALTATFRAELADTDPGIHVSLVSPGIVRTEFGVNAVHGGPDSRGLPASQSAEEVAAVIAQVIASPRPDVYTRPDGRQLVLDYFATHGSNPE
jgi:NAD(P)-dependent dehydrogenase (short-subunit alcohol dehydrogenase family)